MGHGLKCKNKLLGALLGLGKEFLGHEKHEPEMKKIGKLDFKLRSFCFQKTVKKKIRQNID